MQRDPKGHYERAKDGGIPDFTGVTSEYQNPSCPDVHLHTDIQSVDDCVKEILSAMKTQTSSL